MSSPPSTSMNSQKQAESHISVYDGSEPFFAFFSQAQVALATLRLSLEDRVIVQTTDLASQMETARRTFQHLGKFPETIQEVIRICAQFQQRFQSWAREAQMKEKGKQAVTGAQLQRLKSEISQVRMKAQMTERVVAKLEIVLHQLEAEENEKQADASNSDADPDVQLVDEQIDEALQRILGTGLSFDTTEANSSSNDYWEWLYDDAVLYFIAITNTQSEAKIVEFLVIPKFHEVSERLSRYVMKCGVNIVQDETVKSLRWSIQAGDKLRWHESSRIKEQVEAKIIKRLSKGNGFKFLHASTSLKDNNLFLIQLSSISAD